MEHMFVWPFWIEVARACLSVSLLDSWLVHPIVVGFLTVYAAAAVNSPHGRCGSCFFRWQQQNSSSRVMITHISSRNRRRGFFLTLSHPRRFDPGDSVVKQMQLSLLIAATRKRADWRRGNDETGYRILCADACLILCAEYCAEYCRILCRIFCADACWGESIVMGWTHLVLLGFVIYWRVQKITNTWNDFSSLLMDCNSIIWNGMIGPTAGMGGGNLSDILNSTLPSPHQVGLSAG